MWGDHWLGVIIDCISLFGVLSQNVHFKNTCGDTLTVSKSTPIFIPWNSKQKRLFPRGFTNSDIFRNLVELNIISMMVRCKMFCCSQQWRFIGENVDMVFTPGWWLLYLCAPYDHRDILNRQAHIIIHVEAILQSLKILHSKVLYLLVFYDINFLQDLT